MIEKSECYIGTCDNCGDIFDDGTFSLFPSEEHIKEEMTESDWYADGSDPDHKGKYYCEACFKYHDEIDDKIIVNLDRKDLHNK